LDYLELERKNLKKKFTNYEMFNNFFQINTDFLDHFVDYAREKGVDPTPEDLILSGDIIKFQIKALIARNLFEFKSYFQVMTQIDDGFKKAVEVIENDGNFTGLISQQ